MRQHERLIDADPHRGGDEQCIDEDDSTAFALHGRHIRRCRTERDVIAINNDNDNNQACRSVSCTLVQIQMITKHLTLFAHHTTIIILVRACADDLYNYLGPFR